MGMFDYIKCEAPLPDGFDGELQTKDFDCEMTTHIITKDGRLMLGSIRRVHKYEDANFHGLVHFYGTDADENWHEYNARFTDGQLVRIDLVA